MGCFEEIGGKRNREKIKKIENSLIGVNDKMKPEYVYSAINYNFPKNAKTQSEINSASFPTTRSFSFVGIFYEIRSSYISFYSCTYLSLQTSLTLIRTAYFPNLNALAFALSRTIVPQKDIACTSTYFLTKLENIPIYVRYM